MGITPETYYEKDDYMSVSAFKKFQKCELDGLEDWSDPSLAMLIGSYVDSYVEGTLEQFKKEHPDIFSTRGATKGKLKSDYILADKICEYIDNDPVMQQFMSGEKQTIMTGEIEGVPFKIKMDSYSPDIAINDLKIMRTVTDKHGNFYDFITPWGYDTQLACYQEIVRQNTGKKLPCYICAVSKEDPINSVIIHIPQEFLDRALAKVELDIKHYYDVKMGKAEPQRCGVCDTCIRTRKETPIISLYEVMEGYNE